MLIKSIKTSESEIHNLLNLS